MICVMGKEHVVIQRCMFFFYRIVTDIQLPVEGIRKPRYCFMICEIVLCICKLTHVVNVDRVAGQAANPSAGFGIFNDNLDEMRYI